MSFGLRKGGRRGKGKGERRLFSWDRDREGVFGWSDTEVCSHVLDTFELAEGGMDLVDGPWRCLFIQWKEVDHWDSTTATVGEGEG